MLIQHEEGWYFAELNTGDVCVSWILQIRHVCTVHRGMMTHLSPLSIFEPLLSLLLKSILYISSGLNPLSIKSTSLSFVNST